MRKLGAGIGSILSTWMKPFRISDVICTDILVLVWAFPQGLYPHIYKYTLILVLLQCDIISEELMQTLYL